MVSYAWMPQYVEDVVSISASWYMVYRIVLGERAGVNYRVCANTRF